MALTREQILAAVDLRFEDVDVPEWGGRLRLYELSGAERIALDDVTDELKEAGKKEPTMRFAARLLVLAVRTEAGDRMFEDSDVGLLVRKNPNVLARLFERAAALSAVT